MNKYSCEAYYVLVDINGLKGPNMIGKDLFALFVDTKGIVIPYGGALFKEWNDDSVVRWTEQCNKEGVTLAWYCAGSIADNGWQVIYPY